MGSSPTDTTYHLKQGDCRLEEIYRAIPPLPLVKTVSNRGSDLHSSFLAIFRVI
jgi:hypothetical protein